MVKPLRTIPEAVRAAQVRASDPAASAFVSANAGSGKTHVLVQRVIRLLLSGGLLAAARGGSERNSDGEEDGERLVQHFGCWVEG